MIGHESKCSVWGVKPHNYCIFTRLSNKSNSGGRRRRDATRRCHPCEPWVTVHVNRIGKRRVSHKVFFLSPAGNRNQWIADFKSKVLGAKTASIKMFCNFFPLLIISLFCLLFSPEPLWGMRDEELIADWICLYSVTLFSCGFAGRFSCFCGSANKHRDSSRSLRCARRR